MMARAIYQEAALEVMGEDRGVGQGIVTPQCSPSGLPR